MRNIQLEGIIIKRHDVGEADKILTVFTKHKGKIQIKAKGIRRIASRRSAHVELLNHAQLTLFQGKSMPILTEAQMVSDFGLIKNDLQKVGFAYHMCELINGLCAEDQEHPQVFDLLLKTLKQLSETEDIAQVVHAFEVELLVLLGYWNKARQEAPNNVDMFIERILERKLKSKAFISKLSS